MKRHSSCHTLSRCVFFGSCTFKYTPFQKASRFASGKRLTLKTSVEPTLRKLKSNASRNTVSPLRAPWSRTSVYAPVVAYAGSLSFARLTLKTSLEAALRKFRRHSSRETAGLRFGLVGTIMYTPCAESAPFASDERLTLKTSLYPTSMLPDMVRSGTNLSPASPYGKGRWRRPIHTSPF